MASARHLQFGERLRGVLSGGERVLEIAARDPEGSARDASGAAVGEWVRIAPEAGPDVDVALDATRITEYFQEDSFDAVLSAADLGGWRDWRRAAREMLRALRPGGTLLLAALPPGDEEGDGADGFWRFTRDDLELAFGAAGRVERVEGLAGAVGVAVVKRQGYDDQAFGGRLLDVVPTPAPGQDRDALELQGVVPFDQHSRLMACAQALGALSSPGDTVLDVGSGPECLLGRYLPGRRVSYLDPLIAKREFPSAHQLADDLGSLGDRRFDHVSAIDVLEHIAPEARGEFIADLCSRADKGLLLAFPARDYGEAACVDDACDAAFRAAYGSANPWLEEHRDNGLPSLEEVLKQLADAGFATAVQPHGFVPWLSRLFPMFLRLWELPRARSEALSLSREYNEVFAPYDCREPAYRAVVTAWRDEDRAPVFDPCPAPPGDASSRWEEFLARAESVVYGVAREQEAELDRRHAKLMELSDWGGGLKDELQATQGDLEACRSLERKVRTERDGALENLEATREMLAQSTRQVEELEDDRSRVQGELMAMSHWAAGMRDRLAVLDSCFPLYVQERLLAAVRERGLRGAASMLASRLVPRRIRNALRDRAKRRELAALREDVARDPGRVLVVYPIIPWEFRWQRPQQIVSRLAREGWTVLYADMRPRPAGRCYATDAEAFADVDVRSLDRGVWGVSLCCCQDLDLYACCPDESSLGNMTGGVLSLLAAVGAREPVQIVHFPSWAPLAFEVRGAVGGAVVFDCMDDHGGFANTTQDAVRAEADLLGRADLVLTSSDLLYEKAAARNPATVMLRNGTEFEHFHAPRKNGELDHLADKPVIGYYGAIAEWFDVELLRHCAEARPEWNFVLIGAAHGCDGSRVAHLGNVHFLGEKPYKDLPGYFAYFDVCTIPFQLVPLILATNPVKFYEYLSDARPVVSVDLPELRPYADLCYLARDHDEFLRGLDEALAERPDPALREARLTLARENSWDGRVEALLATDVFRR